jgi:general secretion pathway protein J
MNRQSGQSGFTLLELMIGLALLGMLLVLLFGALRLGALSWDAGERKLELASSQGIVSGFLRKTLEQVFPLYFKGSGVSVLAFEGEAGALKFAGRVPARQGFGGLYLISIEQQEDRLGLRWQMPGADIQDFSMLDQAESIVLLRGLKSIRVDYFGAPGDEAEPSWQAAWHSDKKLPMLIRVVLTPLEGPVWPEITVAPMRANIPAVAP